MFSEVVCVDLITKIRIFISHNYNTFSLVFHFEGTFIYHIVRIFFKLHHNKKFFLELQTWYIYNPLFLLNIWWKYFLTILYAVSVFKHNMTSYVFLSIKLCSTDFVVLLQRKVTLKNSVVSRTGMHFHIIIQQIFEWWREMVHLTDFIIPRYNKNTPSITGQVE